MDPLPAIAQRQMASVCCIPGLVVLAKGSRELAGPTDFSNWVVQGHVVCGAFPGHTEEPHHTQTLVAILKSDITVFADLTEENEVHGCLPYKALAQELHSTQRSEFPQPRLSFLHCPIPDEVMTAFVEQLADALRNDEKLYIHSNGGHGRTGTVVALLLVRIYGVAAEEALTKTCQFHDYRLVTRGTSSPQRVVRRLAPQMQALYQRDITTAGPLVELPNEPEPMIIDSTVPQS